MNNNSQHQVDFLLTKIVEVARHLSFLQNILKDYQKEDFSNFINYILAYSEKELREAEWHLQPDNKFYRLNYKKLDRLVKDLDDKGYSQPLKKEYWDLVKKYKNNTEEDI